MREKLGNVYGQRRRFSGRFVRVGKKPAYRGWGSNRDGTDATILLQEIRDGEGRLVADHLWFNLTQHFEELYLVEGEIVSFDARVGDYVKGYERDGFDYKLSRPTKIVGHGCPDWIDYDGPKEYIKNPGAENSKDN